MKNTFGKIPTFTVNAFVAMKNTFGKTLPFSFSAVEAISGAASTGSSLLVSGATSAKLSKTRYGVSYGFGALTGIIEFITSYCFQGAEIRKRWSDDPTDSSDSDSDEEKLTEYFQEPIISSQRKGAYMALKYSYVASSIVVNYLGICLLYSAGKAWAEDLKDGEDAPLTFISHSEAAVIGLYYLVLDLPLILTAEVPQTCKEIRKLFNIPANNTPDKNVTDLIFRAARPIAKSYFARKFVRVTGAFTDTTQHMGPLVLILPRSWALYIASSLPLLCASSFGLLVITGTILAQTYLFEGRFSEENLKAIAGEFGEVFKKEEKWVRPWIAKVFNKLLYLGGPLHGVDAGLDILLTLRELGAPAPLDHITAALTFIIAWLGNHYSEVLESQEELQKITRDHSLAQIMTNSSSVMFFSKPPNYGTTDYSIQKEPTGLLEYVTPREGFTL